MLRIMLRKKLTAQVRAQLSEIHRQQRANLVTALPVIRQHIAEDDPVDVWLTLMRFNQRLAPRRHPGSRQLLNQLLATALMELALHTDGREHTREEHTS